MRTGWAEPQTIQFLLALGIGGAIGLAGVGLGAAVAWILAVSFGLSFITAAIETIRRISPLLRSPDTAALLRSRQNPGGIFSPAKLFAGLFAYLFFGTIATMAIPAVVTALLFGGGR